MSVKERHREPSPESPFAEPHYGKEAETPGFLLASGTSLPPGKVQCAQTGLCGLAVILCAAATLSFFHGNQQVAETHIWAWRRLVVLASVFAAMAAYEILVVKVHRRNFDFGAARKLDSKAQERINLRLAASFVCLVILTLVFSFIEVFISGFLVFYMIFLPFVVIALPGYFMIVEKYGRASPVIDELLVMGISLKRVFLYLAGKNSAADAKSALDNAHVKNLMRSCLVKGIFIPVMFLSYLTWWHLVEHSGGSLMAHQLDFQVGSYAWAESVRNIAGFALYLILAVDLTVVLLGYSISTRLFDNQFTSVEPTLGGWVVALICYPPFNAIVETLVWSKIFFIWPVAAFMKFPHFSVAMTLIALALIAIYSWSTVCFGLRFANLSNRGIIFHGPYRFVRHPAYAAKNLFWWFAFAPLLITHNHGAVVAALSLFCLNFIYVLRAITEERHLSREPHYLEYLSRVRNRFIPWLI